MNAWLKRTRTWLQDRWRDWRPVALPSVIAVASLAGFVLILVNPFCYCSTSECMGHCEFAPRNAFQPYLGKAAGLQLFATGFLTAAAVLSWPALRAQIFRCKGKQGEEWLKFCFTLGYLVMLLGIWIDMYSDNPELAVYIITVLSISLYVIGWGFIGSAAWIIIQVVKFLYNKLKKSATYRDLMSRCVFVCCLVRKKTSLNSFPKLSRLRHRRFPVVVALRWRRGTRCVVILVRIAFR